MTAILHHQQPVRIRNLGRIATATLAATVALAATAHADSYERFQSPSGNIRCVASPAGNPGAIECGVRDHTYVVPTDDIGGCQDKRFPRGDHLTLAGGGTAYFDCPGPAFDSGLWPTLEYGQTRSFGEFACDSEPSGMTCTNSSTGHFFRISRDSYQVG